MSTWQGYVIGLSLLSGRAMRRLLMDAEKRYTILREQGLKAAVRIYCELGIDNLKATIIIHEALLSSKQWSQSTTRRYNWDWLDGYGSFRFRYPKRFEMALWQTNDLIGLSMGRPTYNGTALRLDIVEASPSDLAERPSIFPFILVAYNTYARLIHASQLRIMDPVNEQVKQYYESFGYKYVANGDYLFKEVSP